MIYCIASTRTLDHPYDFYVLDTWIMSTDWLMM